MEKRPQEIIADKVVLLIDGSIHSGKTFLNSYRSVESLKPTDIVSYSLVVRIGASFLPSFFGVTISDHDRALFLREKFPNNRLPPFGTIRRLAEQDQFRPRMRCGEEFIDKFTWGDFWYESRIDPCRHTYLYERGGTLLGLLSFKLFPGKKILVDTVAADQSAQGQGIGGNLLRWAETTGRNLDCTYIQLWGVERKVQWYENLGYKKRGERLNLDGTDFWLMEKKLLYNLPEDDVLTMD